MLCLCVSLSLNFYIFVLCTFISSYTFYNSNHLTLYTYIFFIYPFQYMRHSTINFFSLNMYISPYLLSRLSFYSNAEYKYTYSLIVFFNWCELGLLTLLSEPAQRAKYFVEFTTTTFLFQQWWGSLLLFDLFIFSRLSRLFSLLVLKSFTATIYFTSRKFKHIFP